MDGNRLVDLATGIAVLNVGHTAPEVVLAAQRQLELDTHSCFHVTANGVGAATFDVGCANRAAFGLSATDCTVRTVLDLLLAADARSRNGVLDDLDGSGTISSSERSLRVMANNVFTAINEHGDL